MRKNRLFGKCLPFLLSAALMLAPAAAVCADNPAGGAAQTGIAAQAGIAAGDEEEVTEAGEVPAAEEYAEDDEKGYGNPAAVLSGDPTEDKTVEKAPADGEKASEEQEKAEQEGAEPDKEQAADPDQTPYEELLNKENLVIVTVEQDDSKRQPEEKLEAVEDLSGQEMEALEEYIEEQGFEVSEKAMLAAAASTEVRTITFYMSGFVSYEAEGFGKGYDAVFIVDQANYKGNGNAYCIEPEKQSPGHDQQNVSISYTTTVRDYTDSLLVKLMYYGFGGPGDITEDHAFTPTARHILTHMAVTRRTGELGIPGSGSYTYRANETAIAKADALYDAVRNMPDIQGRVSVLTPVEGQQTILLLSDFRDKPEPTYADLSVTKKVTGSAGNKNTEFHFQLLLTPEDGQELPETLTYILSEEGKEEQTGTLERTEDSNAFPFALSHGQTIVFRQLETGLSYAFSELDGEEQGYTVTAQHASGKLTASGASVVFINDKEMIIPTGTVLSTGTEGALLAVAGMMLAGMTALRRRRKR